MAAKLRPARPHRLGRRGRRPSQVAPNLAGTSRPSHEVPTGAANQTGCSVPWVDSIGYQALDPLVGQAVGPRNCGPAASEAAPETPLPISRESHLALATTVRPDHQAATRMDLPHVVCRQPRWWLRWF